MTTKKTNNVKQKLEKADSLPNPTIPSTVPVGQPQLKLASSFVDELKKEELKVPKIFDTFDQMEQDPCVYNPLFLTQTLVTLALAQGSFVSSGTRKSKVIAEYVNYAINNMRGQTWLSAVENFNTDIKYGFSLSELTIRKATTGQFKGSYVIDQIGPRSQKSVYAWMWDKDQRNMTHVVQKPLKTTNYLIQPRDKPYLGSITDLQALHGYSTDSTKYPIIPASSLLHFTYNSTNNNPQGSSPLVACFSPWKEKEIISQYQVIGITRDFGGIPIARVPSELMRRANDPDHLYPQDELEYAAYQDQLANMHSGKQSYFILSSDLAEGSTTQFEYDIKLLGIEGSGKQFDTSSIIKDKTTEIYNAFGAGYLILGQGDTTSSYNLSTTGRTVHSFIIEKAILSKVSVLENRLVPALLAANNIDWSYKDLPKFVYKDPDQLSLDEAGKFLQRAKSVGALAKGAAEQVYKWCGLPTDGLDDLDFSGEDQSRAGESGGTSGTGGSQQGGAASTVNVENKQLTEGDIIKNYMVVDTHKDQDVLYDMTTKEVLFKDKVSK